MTSHGSIDYLGMLALGAMLCQFVNWFWKRHGARIWFNWRHCGPARTIHKPSSCDIKKKIVQAKNPK